VALQAPDMSCMKPSCLWRLGDLVQVHVRRVASVTHGTSWVRSTLS
jgi:hypothetical protein